MAEEKDKPKSTGQGASQSTAQSTSQSTTQSTGEAAPTETPQSTAKTATPAGGAAQDGKASTTPTAADSGGTPAATTKATESAKSTTGTPAEEDGAGGKGAVKVKTKWSFVNILATIVAVILILLIIPTVTVTITLSVKSAINPDDPPSIFGYAPLTVASGSMSGHNEDSFDEGDLIFIKILDDEEKNSLQVNDVICYTTDGVLVTHRIISITEDNGVITSLITMGDANATADDAITTDSIYGIYAGKIKNLGSFAEFLQTPAGIAVFIAVPVMAFIIYDVAMIILRKEKAADKSKDEEIERLKKMLNDKDNTSGDDDT